MGTTVHVGDDADQLPSLASALDDPAVGEIVIHPGTYVEHVWIARRREPLLIRSSTGRADDVVITFDLRQGDRDPTGLPYAQRCATLTIEADDVTLRGLTVRNTFDARATPDLPDSQALALRTLGTRITLQGCHLLGRQDTLLLDAPSWAEVNHVLVEDCLVTGTVDFIYGRATALIRRGEVRSLDAGYIAAPCTSREVPRGFLFHDVRLTAADDVAPGSVRLARPWHPGGQIDAIGAAVFVSCRIGPHVAADRWEEMGGFSWREGGRFGEALSILEDGAVAASPEHRLEPEAPERLVTDHLAGWDWPVPPVPARPGAKIHVLSDSTASPYPPDRAPRTGWAQALPDVTGVDREVSNHAVSGMSTQSLVDSGHLDAVLAEVGMGDLVLIGFGHNDSKTDHRAADPYRAYPHNLRRVIAGARARGATPVLLTSIERRRFTGGVAVASHGGYPEAVRRLAREARLPLIDLTLLTRALWQRQGEEGSKDSFLWLEPGQWPGYPEGERDDTHLSAAGAAAVAALVADGLVELGLIPAA